eukprot:22315_1
MSRDQQLAINQSLLQYRADQNTQLETALNASLFELEIQNIKDMEIQNILQQSYKSDLEHKQDLEDATPKSYAIMGSAQIHEQSGGHCYANAVVEAVQSCEGRIIGRRPTDYERLLNNLIAQFGVNGAIVDRVLDYVCHLFKLRYSKVQQIGAENAVRRGRVVVGSFWLCGGGWNKFSEFFKKNPAGILSKNDIDIGNTNNKTTGHSVAIIAESKDKLIWKIKNSWGNKFADQGYFRVKKNALDFVYHDVYFVEADLSEHEKKCYQKHQKVLAYRQTKRRIENDSVLPFKRQRLYHN